MVDGPTITGEAQDDGTDELMAALDSSNKGVAEDFTGEEENEQSGETSEKGTAEEASTGKGDETEEAGETKKEESAEEAPKKDLFDKEEENRELRQLLRAQKRELAILKAKMDRLGKRAPVQAKKTSDEESLFGEEETETQVAEEKEELSPLEEAQLKIQTLAETRGPILDALVEAMELNPKYSDVAEVCSQANFEDMFEAMGKAISQQKGTDPILAAAEAEASVWAMRNPYRFMYDLIKKHHPAYIAKSEGAKDKKEGETEKAAVPKKEPVKAPSSIAGMTGKTTAENSWTAARIDEMDEQELTEVPPKIYDKYLRGELD